MARSAPTDRTPPGAATAPGAGLVVEITDPPRGLDVALELAPGRTLALLGPNGAGKSTVLRTIAGLHAPARARVVVGDTVLSDVGTGGRAFWSPPRQRAVGLLDQQPDLFGHLTVRGNVMFGPRAAGASRHEARTFADHLLDAVGARDLARRRARALSGGQAQRVALARALAASPRVLLLDEPFAAVDAPSARELREVLRRVLDGVTAVVVTHDVADVRALADDVVVLDGGRVVEQGPAAELLAAPRSAFLKDLLEHDDEADDLGPTPPSPAVGVISGPDRPGSGGSAAPEITPTAGRRSVAEHAAAVESLVAPALAAGRLAGGEAATVRVADLLARAAADAALPPRVLARDARAAVALPGFDNSQMDGYAVRAADLAGATPDAPAALPVAAPVPAGTEPPPLAPGTAAPVMTGAPIPAGADAVVRVEDASPSSFAELSGAGDPGGSRDPDNSTVRFSVPVAPGTYVRRAGSDVAAGEVVVGAGTPLGPAQLGALAAAGVEEVAVAPPPHVLLVSTGSELVPAGAPLGPAQVHDANGATLAAALAQAGARVTTRVVPDSPDALRAVLADAPADVALVVTTGGVSAGAYEVVRQTFDDAWFGHVAVQPGGPQGLGTVTLPPPELSGPGPGIPGREPDNSGAEGRTVPLVAFPGNPVSAYVSFELFLRPVLARATGAVPAARPRGRARLAEPLDSPPALHQVRRGMLDDAGRVRLVGGPGSHLVSHLAAATLLVHVPPGVARLERGDDVDYWEIR
ncbi:gephyrin-like molybdotransferase Glp [Isoptericola variabilis]|nr:gephyrin-like molybdotransferase Glp [Isoptericola variabilis]